MQEQYNPKTIEENTQEHWDNNNSFQVTEDTNKEKFYCLTMFPYPSGRLHMGHARVYTIGDVISRYQRTKGKNVLQPMGWDAFGLPAENAAKKNKIPPAEWTYKNISFMKKQMQSLGLSYDWSREFATCSPDYYKWEQWFFTKLFKKSLVYKKNSEVNWDPVDQTVLANEQVVDGRGWRSGAIVERREIPQWFFKITDYADELLKDTDKLSGWPDQVKAMQKNWIGKSTGVEVSFKANDNDLKIFTTRPDTLFGVTYIAVATRHPLAIAAAEKNPEIKQFLEEFKNVKVAEADIATMEKRGLPLGITAKHPISGADIPVWVANFVLMDYGSGAVMAVPAHDQRDFEFAKQYKLPIKQVITPSDQSTWDFAKGAMTDTGELIESDQFTGFTSKEASAKIIEFLENHDQGQSQINYRLRDWGVSRQRYWGTPIPIIYCEECGPVAVPEADLPVILPEDVKFEGVSSPLKNTKEFYEVSCPECGKPAKRETDTFDTFFESSWYYARFACKNLDTAMLDGRANYWLPVDQYVGGVEHAVLHLLYARFIHKSLRDLNLINSDEPFVRLLTQGHVLNDGIKMSKSKGNIVDPDDLIKRFGADTVRLFIIFASPPEQNLEWSDTGVEGAHRFLKRLWSFAYENKDIIIKQNQNKDSEEFNFDNLTTEQKAVLREIYSILDQTKFDYERLQLNTVVSSCMKLLNSLTKLPDSNNDYIIFEGISLLIKLLSPIAPHITHKLWAELHYAGELQSTPLPKGNAASVKMDTMDLVVQINGKLRTKISVPTKADNKAIEEIALQDLKVQKTLEDKNVVKMITVPGRLINIVTTNK